jgi:NTE family protein
MATAKRVNLALQGGGAHGAFTWGVLDFLLEDPRIEIAAISGTSAGAMNAAVLADGMAKAGRDGARAALEAFWQAVSRVGAWSPVRRAPIDVLLGRSSLDRSPAFAMMDILHRLASPYDFNPLDINPLRELVGRSVDFEAIRASGAIKLFISATNVETGKVRVFDEHEVTLDAVMASSCLPHWFRAVEIDGVPYWDGGYMGNPSLFPFNGPDLPSDVVIVQINPIKRPGTPRSSTEILNRINEITFNSSLLKELRAIEFVSRLLDQGALDPDRYRRLHVHVIDDDAHLQAMGASSKANAEWAFLRTLHCHGREAAARWTDRHSEALGERSSIDLAAMFSDIGTMPHHG